MIDILPFYIAILYCHFILLPIVLSFYIHEYSLRFCFELYDNRVGLSKHYFRTFTRINSIAFLNRFLTALAIHMEHYHTGRTIIVDVP